MRWLFLFVLSLNLAYIGLEMSRPSSAGYEDVSALKSVQSIVLLSELKPQSGSEQVEQVEESEEVAGSESAEDLSIDSTGAESVATITEKAVAVNAAPEQAVAGSREKAEEPEAVSLPQAASMPAKNAVAKESVNAGQEEPVKPAAEELQQSASCFTMGPFRDLGKLRGLTRDIKSYVVEADFRGREEKEPNLYWVYVKPEKNRTQAIKTGKRLKAKKIKDFYVIRDGEKINGLSLGHFRNKKSAYRLAKKVKNLGFDVIVEPVFRTYTIYWLDYQLAAGVTIPESIFDQYTRSTKKEKVTRLRRDCGG